MRLVADTGVLGELCHHEFACLPRKSGRLKTSLLTERKKMNITYISESEITKHLPEYISKSADSDERFVITKDNKPIAALISIEDFQFIEQKEKQKGLASVVGKWKDFDEIEDILSDISSLREKGGMGRDVSF